MKKSNGTVRDLDFVCRDTDKKPHTYPMPYELLYVKDYALTAVDKHRYCVLRWIKRDHIKLDKIVFRLYQYDHAGRELDCTKVTFSDAELPASQPGLPFVTRVGIKIKQKCTELRIELLEVTSSAYTYTVREGYRVSIDYCFDDSWLYLGRSVSGSPLDNKFDASGKKLSIFSKRVARPRLIWLFATFGAISMLVASFTAIFGEYIINLLAELTK